MDLGFNFSFRDVVIVADIWEGKAGPGPLHLRRDLEMTDATTFRQLTNAVEALGLKFHHYVNPAELGEHASEHRQDVVLTIYGGQASRNRMALVPAICETFGLRFLGPDVYGRVIAQDKEVSKRLALDCGVRTPAWRIIRTRDDVRHALRMNMPVVAKPLMEGSSIGISQRNILRNPEMIEQFSIELLEAFKQPVLVEEFVAGREVAYSCIENAGPDAWAFSEVFIEGKPGHFEHRLFDADEKTAPTAGRSVCNIDAELNPEDLHALQNFVSAFGAYGYCRVDGRLANGRFHFLELTPDAWIAPRGQFARGFTEKGWTYERVIGAVLASAG